MFIQTNRNNFGGYVSVSFERRDILRISNIASHCNRFSAGNSNYSMGCFRIQRLLNDKTWSTRYNIPKNVCFLIRQHNGHLLVKVVR